MVTNKQISEIKKQLLADRLQLESQHDRNDSFGLSSGHFHESVGELSSYDNHPGDEGSELYEREKDLALNEHLEYQVKKINRALKAIEDGTYGFCATCGKEIPLERLEALPDTIYCIEHTRDQTISSNRPIEEEILTPPFGRFVLDEKDENVSFDAEDSWQEVARWGTSDTPSDLAFSVKEYTDTYIDSGENIGCVEDYENFVATDITGKEIIVYPSKKHEQYERSLDEMEQ